MGLPVASTSALAAHARLLESAASNIARAGDPTAEVSRVRLTALAPPPLGAGGVRADTTSATPRPAAGVVLDPRLGEAFAGEGVDLVTETTNAVVARLGFEANLAALRSYESFIDATLNLKS